jgi:DNA-binding MarR family transcriptional regulator
MPHVFLSQLHKAHRRISRYLEQRGLPLGLSATDAHIVSYLSVYSPCPVGRISEIFGIKASTLTSLLKRLEARNLVRRRPDDEDKRSFLLDITPEGGLVAEQIHQLLTAFEEEVLLRTSEEEVDGFHAVMAAMSTVTEEDVSHKRRRQHEGP